MARVPEAIQDHQLEVGARTSTCVMRCFLTSTARHWYSWPECKNRIVEVVWAKLAEGFLESYHTHQPCKDIHHLLKGEELESQETKKMTSPPTFHFEILTDVLYYKGKVCVPRASVSDVIYLTHDNNMVRYFAYSKTIDWLKIYHWKQVREFLVSSRVHHVPTKQGRYSKTIRCTVVNGAPNA